MLLGWTWHESAPHFDWFAVDGNADGKGRNVVSLQQPSRVATAQAHEAVAADGGGVGRGHAAQCMRLAVARRVIGKPAVARG